MIEKIKEHPYTVMTIIGALLISVGVMALSTFWGGLITLGIFVISISAISAVNNP